MSSSNNFSSNMYGEGGSWVRKCISLMCVAVILAAFFITRNVSAIPSFARKYKTSCQTCHVAYPKLTPFGEAFRLSGYQYPEGDEDNVKEEPVSLGAEAYKRVWPDGVWPSSIPGTVPISLVGKSSFQSNLKKNAPIKEEFTAPALNLNGAGNLSEDITWWIGAHLFAAGSIGTLERFFVQFLNVADNWGVPRHLLNVRVGQFEPEAQPFSSHRNITWNHLIFTSFMVSDVKRAVSAAHQHLTYDPASLSQSIHYVQNRLPVLVNIKRALPNGPHDYDDAEPAKAESYKGLFALGTPQRGIEVFGNIMPRWRYAIGIVNGNGIGPIVDGSYDFNSEKDAYIRLLWKVGGMGFDGTGGLETAQNWVDNSLSIGAFAYYGDAGIKQSVPVELQLFDGDGNPVIDADGKYSTVTRIIKSEYRNYFYRSGFDVELNVSDFDLFGAVMFGNDTDPFGDGDDVKSFASMAQLDWVIYPWLVGIARYEELRFKEVGNKWSAVRRNFVSGLNVLLRANIRFQIEANINIKKWQEREHAVVLAWYMAF